jgi:hypothetical protein
MQKFLAEINQDLDADKWQVTCHLFAPYAQPRKSHRSGLVRTQKFTQEMLSIL